MKSITINGKESLFTSKGIMTSLHNLKIPLETFHLMEGQKEEILEHLKQCKSCHKDLRQYKHNPNYKPITITDEEYDLCVNEFGSEKSNI